MVADGRMRGICFHEVIGGRQICGTLDYSSLGGGGGSRAFYEEDHSTAVYHNLLSNYTEPSCVHVDN